MNDRSLFRFESRRQPVVSRRGFLRRMARNTGVAGLLIGGSLVIGVLGYRYCECMSWIDAFANAAMILSGMGPLEPLHTWGGKLFAGLYALYSGLALILASGLILAPMLHRVLHSFHVDSEGR